MHDLKKNCSTEKVYLKKKSPVFFFFSPLFWICPVRSALEKQPVKKGRINNLPQYLETDFHCHGKIILRSLLIHVFSSLSHIKMLRWQWLSIEKHNCFIWTMMEIVWLVWSLSRHTETLIQRQRSLTSLWIGLSKPCVWKH